jgi:hypothetical protein
MENIFKQELWEALNEAEKLGIITSDEMAYLWYYKEEGSKWLNAEPSVCDQAPYPECNGAQGCDTCKCNAEIF